MMPARLPVRGSLTRRLVLGATAGTVILTAACSNQQASVNRRPSSGSATATVVDGVQQVVVTASDIYRFSPATITVHPGQVRIVLKNVVAGNAGTAAPHNWTLMGIAATPLTPSGQTSSVSFTAPAPGSYTFVCTIHERQGQTGTLVVLPN